VIFDNDIPVSISIVPTLQRWNASVDAPASSTPNNTAGVISKNTQAYAFTVMWC